MQPVEDRTLTFNGIEHHVALSGSADHPPVLLIHGLGWDGGMWRGHLGRLAARGWHGLAPDLRGMGQTDKPDAPYSIDLYAEDMAALLGALGLERVAVVGFSLGGMIAMRLAERFPELVGGAVFACCGAASSPEGQAGTEAMLERALAIGPRGFAREQAEAVWHPAWAEAHPAAVAEFIAWRAAMDQPALHRAFRSSYGVDLRPALPSMDFPALVIAAKDDSFVSLDTAQSIAGALPQAVLAVIEQAGHMCSIEQPAAFDQALFGFLDWAWPTAAMERRTRA